MTQLRAINWTAVLINLPDQLAELCADALEPGNGAPAISRTMPARCRIYMSGCGRTPKATRPRRPAIERVRSKFIDLASRLARRFEGRGDHKEARAVYLRAIDMYPTSAVCYEGLIRSRLAMQDQAGALLR